MIMAGGTGSSGGSTITQQLVRSVHPEAIGTEFSIQRKWREALAAIALERQFSKHDILTMYVNQIFYGNRSYGIEAAAQYHFNKTAAALSKREAALLDVARAERKESLGANGKRAPGRERLGHAGAQEG